MMAITLQTKYSLKENAYAPLFNGEYVPVTITDIHIKMNKDATETYYVVDNPLIHMVKESELLTRAEADAKSQQITKEENIIFYGENYTPLSKECYGCSHYGSLCSGAVYERECRAGIVEDIAPSIMAGALLRRCKNRFIVARAFGYNLKKIDKKDFKDNKELKDEYKKALEVPESTIQEYRYWYSLDVYAMSKMKTFMPTENNSSTESGNINPFTETKIIDIHDEDLPF